MANRELDVECPSCSPNKKVLHEVLSDSINLVVRCAACHATRKVRYERAPSTTKLRVVTSYHAHSYLRWFEADTHEQLHVGDEIVVENGSAEAVRVTAIEVRDGSRIRHAPVVSIKTLWSRKIDTVIVRIAVHMGGTTERYTTAFEGDKEFIVGSEEKFGKIDRIKVRAGPILARNGERAKARDVRGIFVKRPKRGQTVLHIANQGK